MEQDTETGGGHAPSEEEEEPNALPEVSADSPLPPAPFGNITPEAKLQLDLVNMESEILGVVGRTPVNATNKNKAFKMMALNAAIRQRGASSAVAIGDSDSESSIGTEDSLTAITEVELSLTTPILSDSEMVGQIPTTTLSTNHSDKSDIPPDMPVIGVDARLQRNRSIVNLYGSHFRNFSQSYDESHQIFQISQQPSSSTLRSQIPDLDAELQPAPTPVTKEIPDFMIDIDNETQDSIMKLASDNRRTRAETTEMLQRKHKLTEEEAAEIIAYVKISNEEKVIDLICSLRPDEWKPVDSDWEYPEFEKKNNVLTNLKDSGEFFRYLRRGFTEQSMLVETELPDEQDWINETWRLFALKGRNRVTTITSALRSALHQTEILRQFLEYSTIMFDEKSIDAHSKIVNYSSGWLGHRTFNIGKLSVVPARSFFAFTSRIFTFRDEIWDEALDTTYPGRQLMMEPVFIAPGVDSEIKEKHLKYDTLQRFHHLFLASYIKSMGAANIRSRHMRKPLTFSFDMIYMGQDVPEKMLEPLRKVFGEVHYCLNPSPDQHIRLLLQNHGNLMNVRIMCDTIGWLHTLHFLLNERVAEAGRLQAEIDLWLSRKKPKRQGSKNKSKIRCSVETLKAKMKTETTQLHDMVNKLPRASNFKEMYQDEETKVQNDMKATAERKQTQREAKSASRKPTGPPPSHTSSVKSSSNRFSLMGVKKKRFKGFSLGSKSPKNR